MTTLSDTEVGLVPILELPAERIRPSPTTTTAAKLKRTTFTTSRQLDFFSEKELAAQTGHPMEDWPLVILKELIDNALDACEDAGTKPRIKVIVTDGGIAVCDNGPGIPASTVAGAMDFNVRVSSCEAYVSPSRGAQGNALKTILAMPFVLSGDDGHGRVTITGRGLKHEITISVDRLRQKPAVVYEQSGFVRNGTRVQVEWPYPACSILQEAKQHFLQMAEDFAFLNPHLDLRIRWLGQRIKFQPTDPDWQKWRPCDPTSAHWYSVESAVRLISAYIAHDRDRGKDRTVREFVSEFRGLSSTAKQKKVLNAVGLVRTNLSDLVGAEGAVNRKVVAVLFHAMRQHSKTVKPPMLGILGEDSIKQRFANFGCQMESFEYRKIAAVGSDNLPLVIETAFAWRGNHGQRRLVTGVNWSAAIVDPFRQLAGNSLSSILAERYASHNEPIVFLLHVARPRVEYTDRGKSAVIISAKDSQDILSAVQTVTARWYRQRKSEERDTARAQRRWDALARSGRTTVREAAWEVMPAVYLKVSDGGRYPAHARQMMYGARPLILDRTARESLDDDYFTQGLLPDYMAENPEETKDWNIVFDARGHLREPHTRTQVPLGTLDVRGYLQEIDSHRVPPIGARLDAQVFPTCGPRHRYSAVLFCEKEGFNPLFEQVALLERYDIALMSTKGMSNTAARTLVDRLCHDNQDGGIKLLVLHDFDKAGFSISATLQRDTRRYQFQHAVDVIDLGLRLDDVRAYNLESEPCTVQSNAARNLRDNGATDEEIIFLTGDGSGLGRRVELNAFTSGQLVEWIESKLTKYGISKVVPDAATMEAAYRRAIHIRSLNAELEKATAGVVAQVEAIPVDRDAIEAEVKCLLGNDPSLSWDEAVACIAARAALPADVPAQCPGEHQPARGTAEGNSGQARRALPNMTGVDA